MTHLNLDSLDCVHETQTSLLEHCARYFAVTNMGGVWRSGAGWQDFQQGTDEDFDSLLNETKAWKKVLVHVLSKNPECQTLRQLEDAWKKDPVLLSRSVITCY
jgi:hypothetical protein